MSSSDDGSDLVAAFKKGPPKGAVKQAPGRASGQAPPPRKQTSFSPRQFISDDESGEGDRRTSIPFTTSTRKAIAVRVTPVRNRSEYTYYEPQDAVENIVREFQRKGDIIYEVKLTNGRTQQVSLPSFTLAPQ
jgi:hypothetical protein